MTSAAVSTGNAGAGVVARENMVRKGGDSSHSMDDSGVDHKETKAVELLAASVAKKDVKKPKMVSTSAAFREYLHEKNERAGILWQRGEMNTASSANDGSSGVSEDDFHRAVQGMIRAIKEKALRQ